MEGSLSKWTNVMKGWQYRWFVLDDNAGLLSYYTSREKMVKGARRGCVRLKGAVIGIDDEDNTTFTITVDGKTFHFQARNCDEREKWIRYLEDSIIRHEYGCHSSASSIDYSKLLAPTMNQFDKKVAEADAYLQLLIDQVQALEKRSEQIELEQEKELCDIIITNAKMMLEEIKHTIVLLQIAKNSAFPVDGTYHPERETSSMCSLPSDVFTDSRNNDVEMGIEIDDMHRSLPMFRYPLPANYTYATDIPDVSYSSSDEEDYYDARENEYQNNSNSEDMNNSTSEDASPDYNRRLNLTTECSPSATPKRNPSVSTNDTVASGNDVDSRRESLNVVKPFSNSPVVPLLPDGSIDFDALYEDPSEHEQSQPSVIKHLISQVKIGMDLTKVVLPTFILERRSLLEMYSDYFAHPDIFLKAVDLPTPKDRIIQILKWYLSSYHAGRKSSVAKKPYNPVLGETFRCWWDVNEVTNDDRNGVDEQPLNADGPVSWCSNDQLVFIAEQVSHHPPISAFYAEHVNKRVSLCAHLWTKSKFLGLSVGVHNIGHAIVRLLDHKEEYISTFPNGYGRSILTVPWIELGGSTSIKCPQTGYYCNIEFLTKPFYGGKKHRITADVYGPKDKKPFLCISGEWNGVMEAKWTDGPTEVFLDTRKMSGNKKKVKKIEEQENNESRKIWKMVTLGLKYNDVEQATSAKMQIEQKQRDEAQFRKENNEIWKPKWFFEEDGAWWYKNPLEKRLTINFERNNSAN